MPTYTVRDPQTGRSVKLTGDSPPTEAELTDIFAKLAQTQGVTPAAATTSPGKPSDGPKPTTPAEFRDVMGEVARYERERTTAGREMLPAMGGMVGSVLGGIPGAALGGAAGEAVRQLDRRMAGESAPATPVAAAKDIGTAGVVQGAIEGSGQAIAAGGSKLAKWLMNRATSRVTATLARDFPELSDTLIDHALTVSKGGESKARMLLKVAKGKASAALNTAEQAGATVPVQLTPELGESLKTAVIEAAMKTGKAGATTGQPLTVATARLDAPTRALLASVDDAVTTGAPIDLAPKIADIFKTQLQRESRALYRAQHAPNGLPAVTESAAVRAEFASRLNDAIDGLASGYKAANAEAQTMIGASRGIAQSIRPSGNLYQAMVRPAVGAALGGEAGRRQGGTTGAIAGAVTGAALTSPAGMSIAAITLRDPRMQTILRQMPRATAAALTALLAEGVTPQPAHSVGEPR